MTVTPTHILRLYDHLAQHVALDFTADAPHILGCNGTLRHTAAWIAATHADDQAAWQAWLAAMCLDCDCALLLQLTTLVYENSALEGINMRRCSSCNALLALYQVAAAHADDAELRAWAAEAQVPAYLVQLAAQPTAPATIHKVHPSGETFTLTAQQFYTGVLQQIEQQHRCRALTTDEAA